MEALTQDRFQLSDSDLQSLAGRKRLPRHRRGERFLRGPIPWSWIAVAMKLPGRAWHVGTIVWFLAGLQKSSVVSIQYGLAKGAGLDRQVVRRGLRQLELAGLVLVERKPGRCPVVTLLAAPNAMESA